MAFVDPSGWIVEIAQVDREEILERLSEITDHTLAVDDSGHLYISEYSDEIVYEKGNELILRLIESSNTTMLSTTDWYSRTDAGNNPHVKINLMQDSYTRNIDPETGWATLYEKSPNYIVLAHELIHAERNMRGVHLSGMSGHAFKAGGFETTGFWIWKKTMEKGGVEKAPKEEFATVGLRDNRATDITENQIRAEHGLNLRGAYGQLPQDIKEIQFDPGKSSASGNSFINSYTKQSYKAQPTIKVSKSVNKSTRKTISKKGR